MKTKSSIMSLVLIGFYVTSVYDSFYFFGKEDFIYWSIRVYDRHCCRRKRSFVVLFYPILNILSYREKCSFSYILFISNSYLHIQAHSFHLCKLNFEPNIASDLFVKIKASSSIYRSKNNSSFVN